MRTLPAVVQQAIYDSEVALVYKLEQIRKEFGATTAQVARVVEWDDSLLAGRYLDAYGSSDDS